MIKLKLKEIRIERKIPQRKVGYVVDLDQSEISRIENGSRGLTLIEALLLAEFFGVSITDLYEVVENAG